MSQNQSLPTDGFSTTDFLTSHPVLGRIVKLFLRSRRMSYQEICEKVDALPADKRIGREELDETLKNLLEMGWLEAAEDGGVTYYTVNMKPKTGSAEKQDPSKMSNMEFSKGAPEDKPASVTQTAIKAARDLWQSLGSKPDDDK